MFFLVCPVVLKHLAVEGEEKKGDGRLGMGVEGVAVVAGAMREWVAVIIPVAMESWRSQHSSKVLPERDIKRSIQLCDGYKVLEAKGLDI